MTEVLGPIVGSARTMTMLHTSEAFHHTGPQNQPHLAPSRVSQMSRNSSYNPHIAGMGYRGPQAVAVSPYAFQTTPHLRQDNRTQSAPIFRQSMGPPVSSRSYQHQDSSSSSTASTSSSNLSSVGHYTASKDDSLVGLKQRQLPQNHRHSTALTASLSTPDLSLGSYDTVKAFPDRYRRSSRRFEDVPNVPGLPQRSQDSPALTRPHSAQVSSSPQQATISPTSNPVVPPAIARQNSSDDAVNIRQQSSNRYKRRSVGKMESAGPAPVVPVAAPVNPSIPTWSQVVSGRHNPQQPLPPPNRLVRHVRSSSGDLRNSATAPRPSTARHSSAGFARPSTIERRPVTAPGMPTRSRAPVASSSTPDPPKRVPAPSPLSSPVEGESNAKAPVETTSGSSASLESQTSQPSETSPAAQQLAALTGKPASKGMKSRLRRAFSFGSTQELRRATAENNMAAERAKLRKEKYESDREVDAVIAAKQEAAGLGEGIYTHQGDFSASKDNISISSTASSASIMLRKMGKGMKKSTRNLKNLFRPKSVIGSPAADSAMGELGESTAELSLVTVEAERENVNVNLDPHEKPGGGTGYPKLERNSLDAARTYSPEPPSSSHGDSRKSIVGGERERAEVLAAVRKGILKRTGTSSSNGSSPSFVQGETPVLFMPSGGRSVSGTAGERKSSESADKDYFVRPSNYATGSTRSLPTANNKGNISFNSRVSFHDAWSATEYDRRGDIATCNRLTPMLAQQIKEELNTFKMEMEVHEESKPHTHFF